MGNFPCVFRHIYPKLDYVTRKNFTWWAFFRASTQSLAIYKGTITTFSVLEIKLARLGVEPDERVVARQHLAVEGGVVLRRAAARHGAADLDGLVQVHMALLERVRVGPAREDGQRRRHRGRARTRTPLSVPSVSALGLGLGLPGPGPGSGSGLGFGSGFGVATDRAAAGPGPRHPPRASAARGRAEPHHLRRRRRRLLLLGRER